MKRSKRRGKKSQMTYDQYLKTDWWKRRSEQYKRKVGYICEDCGYKPVGELHVHHKTYKRMFREKDKDLEALCRYHHLEVRHGKKKTKEKKICQKKKA